MTNYNFTLGNGDTMSISLINPHVLNVTQDVVMTDYAGLETWHKANTNVFGDGGLTPASNGGSVQQWGDLSGNSRNLGQSTAAFKPQFDWSEAFPFIRFDGADDYMSVDFGIIAQPITIFAVLRIHTDLTQTRYATSGASPSDAGRVELRALGNERIALHAGSNLAGSNPIGVGNWAVVSAVADGASSKIWINGVLEAQGSAGTRDLGGLTLGCGNTQDRHASVDIAEFAVFSQIHSDVDRQAIEDGLIAKYV